MPELPEVETTRQGITPHIHHRKITHIIIRNRQLRWFVTRRLEAVLTGQVIQSVGRRGKYLLFQTRAGTMILHLGMSGSLRIVDEHMAINKHDHADFRLNHGKILRFHDPRRFGSIHWTTRSAAQHRLIASLGPEPLDQKFNGQHLYRQSRTRSATVKDFIMNSRIVAGIGNIYASESLHVAGIHPKRAANKVSRARYDKLCAAIRQVLLAAINSGGSTLNDFIKPDGHPGYFQHHFSVYGKTGTPCENCQTRIRQITQGQRSTFYCPHCQT